MSPREALRSAFESLAGHKLRSALTMLGMIFGVGAVIAMLSIGEGAERQAQASIERLGLRNVLVQARKLGLQEAERVRAKSPGLTPRDVAALEGAVAGVELVAARVALPSKQVRSAETKVEGVQVFGVSPRYPEVIPVEVREGRFLDARDEEHHAQVAVLSAGVRQRLFGFEPALGKDIKVDDVWLEVVGVLAPTPGASEAAASAAVGEVFLPASAARRKFRLDALASPYDELIVRLSPESEPARAAEQIGQLLTRLHAGETDYELVVPEALLAESRRTQRLFRVVMASIAGISLLVGGIGIMNILLATVLERTREIGVRRAVGARRRDIQVQFLAEALTLAGVGGILGIAFGLAMARIVAAAAGWSTVVTPGSVLLATGVATLVGLVSGLYPAARAASLDPAEALRWE